MIKIKKHFFVFAFLMISTQTFDHAFFEVLLLIIKIEVTLLSIATNFYGLVFDFSPSPFLDQANFLTIMPALLNFLSLFFASAGTKIKRNTPTLKSSHS